MHFRISLVACIINFRLEHSFYIDIDKKIISYFSTEKMIFVLLFLYIFGKQLEDKWWLGVGLDKYDRQTVVTRGVNLSWLRRLLCNGGVIV